MTEHDCGHECCDIRTDRLHDHFLRSADCGACRNIRALADMNATDETPRAKLINQTQETK